MHFWGTIFLMVYPPLNLLCEIYDASFGFS